MVSIPIGENDTRGKKFRSQPPSLSLIAKRASIAIHITKEKRGSHSLNRTTSVQT